MTSHTNIEKIIIHLSHSSLLFYRNIILLLTLIHAVSFLLLRGMQKGTNLITMTTQTLPPSRHATSSSYEFGLEDRVF
jgi:hypothetical protein